jgi:hypothetical protein
LSHIRASNALRYIKMIVFALQPLMEFGGRYYSQFKKLIEIKALS